MAVVYLNGEFLPAEEAQVSVLDRGFIFGDGVYEVVPAYGRKLFGLEEHLTRLDNSLKAIRLDVAFDHDQWCQILNELVAKNEGEDQSVYLQVTRGVAARDHKFPKAKPTIFAMSNPLSPMADELKAQGVKAIVLNDYRWQKCNIKSTSLLANVLLRQEASEAGAAEAILLRDGIATEGAASNLFIVKDGVLKTPPKSNHLLPGITRDLIVAIARDKSLAIDECEILEAELRDADEIWVTSSTKEMLPVTQLDDTQIGNGKPGEVWKQMYQWYQEKKVELRQGEGC